MQESDPMTTYGDRLTLEHRELDELLGRFLAAAHAGADEAARQSISQFDEELRRHMAFEEEHVLPATAGHKLAPGEGETAAEALSRELRVEHVQIRELSGMMRHVLEDQNDLEGARRLFPNLARRWDAHTTKEERALGPDLDSRHAHGALARPVELDQEDTLPPSERKFAVFERHEPCIADRLGKKMRSRIPLPVVEPHVGHPGVERALDVAGHGGIPRLAHRHRGRRVRCGDQERAAVAGERLCGPLDLLRDVEPLDLARALHAELGDGRHGAILRRYPSRVAGGGAA